MADDDGLQACAFCADPCPDCGEPVPIGGWPFCASVANPQGHAKGTYRFRMRMTMKTNGWTRRER